MPRRILCVLTLVALCLTACSGGGQFEVVSETEEPTYRRGEQYMRERNFDEALAAYLKVIDKRKREDSEAPESHLAVGDLYLNYVNDPIAAIYHLREYLRLRPDSPKTDNVEAMITTARKAFAKELPGQPYSEGLDRMDLMELVKQQREESLRLKKQLALANQRLRALGSGAMQVAVTSGADDADNPDFYTPPSQVRQTETESVPTNTPTSYTVERGDSLYRISSRVYRSGAHWRKIFEANRDQLNSPQSLKPGMVLRIPPLE